MSGFVTSPGGGDQLAYFEPNYATYPSANPAQASSRNLHPVLAFDNATAESVIFHGVMSQDYKGAAFDVHIDWAGAAAAGGVTWGVEFERIDPTGAGHDIDADSFAAQVTGTTTTNGTSGIANRTTITVTNAQADTIAAGDPFRLRIQRVVADGGDTMAADAQILRVLLEQG